MPLSKGPSNSRKHEVWSEQVKAQHTWEVLGSEHCGRPVLSKRRKVRSSGLREDSSTGAGPWKKAFSRGNLSMCCKATR